MAQKIRKPIVKKNRTNLGTGVVLDISREMKSIILSNIYNERFD